jgi:hypothetical protein
MLRLSNAEYRKMFGTSNKIVSCQIEQPKRNIKLVVTQCIENIRTARITSIWKPEQSFLVEWDGATVLTLNELLRTDYRSLSGYRKVWKKACRDAVLSAGAICSIKTPVVVKLYRRSGRMIDNDGLSAAFKFAIDGMRFARLIPDDNPKVIADIKLEQEIGEPLLRMVFEVIK